MSSPVSGGLVVVRPPLLSVPSSGRLGFTLLSDLHVGAAQTDHAAIVRELRAAKARGDRISVNGDLLDAIIAKDQKRYRPSALHPRLAGKDDIIGEAVNWVEELLWPVAEPGVDLLDMLGDGNHDDTITKVCSFNPVRELVRRLRARGSHVQYGGYLGFLDYRIKRHDGLPRDRCVVFYHHGTGGGAALAGVAGDAAKLSWIEGTDVLWLGHKHQPMSIPLCRISCPKQGHACRFRPVRFVRSGAYMNAYTGQSADDALKNGRQCFYASDGGYAPQPMGGARVKLRFEKGVPGFDLKVEQ